MTAEWLGTKVGSADEGLVVGCDIREIKSHLTECLKVIGRSEMEIHCRALRRGET